MIVNIGTKEIHTSRLILRRYVIEDAESIFRNYGKDERVTKFLNWEPYTEVEGVRDFIRGVIESYEDHRTYHWAIEYLGEVIGSISVMNADDERKNCEVGYCIGAEYWNQGLTTEALQAVIRVMFEKVGMHRIMAKHDVENPASGKVMCKCNMQYEGRWRDYYLRHDGTYSDSLSYAIIN